MDDLVLDIRSSFDKNKSKSPKSDLASLATRFSTPKPKQDKIQLNPLDTPTLSIYNKQSDGTYQVKAKEFTDSYVYGIDNLESLAQSQSTGEKWKNGLIKYGAKTGVNVVGNFVSGLYGIGKALSEGRLSGIYDNSFTDWVNEANEYLDFELPNYYKQEEQNKNLLQKSLTANFWANDFLGGLSFLTGTIVSETAMAALTGGGSLTTTLPRLGLRAASKTAQKALSQSAKKTLQQSYKSLLKAASSSDVKDSLNAGRLLLTATSYEAALEAKSVFDNSIKQYEDWYLSTNQSDKLNNDYAQILDEARRASNAVFGLNVGLVGASNMVTFGNLNPSLKRINQKIAKRFSPSNFLNNEVRKQGSSFVFSQTGVQKGTYKAIKALGEPLKEGFIEEGGQGVISKSAERFLENQYNPEFTKNSRGLLDIVTESFKEQYGTKEGFTEIGLGMLIGGAGKIMMRGPKEMSEEQKQSVANELNAFQTEQKKNLDSPLKKTLDLVRLHNAQSSYAKQASEKENAVDQDIDLNSSDWAGLALYDRAGVLDDVVESFDQMVDSNSSFSDQFTQEELNQAKLELKDSKRQQVERYKESVRISKSILGNQPQEIQDSLAHSVYMSKYVQDNINESLESISEDFGGGVSTYLKIQSLSDKEQSLLSEYEDLYNEELSLSDSKDESSASRIQSVQKRKQKVLSQLESYNTILDKISPVDYTLIDEYLENKEATNDFLENLKESNTPKYNKLKEQIGKISSLNKYYRQFNKDFSDLSNESMSKQAYDSLLKKYNGTRQSIPNLDGMNESDRFTFEVLNGLLTRGQDPVATQTQEETTILEEEDFIPEESILNEVQQDDEVKVEEVIDPKLSEIVEDLEKAESLSPEEREKKQIELEELTKDLSEDEVQDLENEGNIKRYEESKKPHTITDKEFINSVQKDIDYSKSSADVSNVYDVVTIFTNKNTYFISNITLPGFLSNIQNVGSIEQIDSSNGITTFSANIGGQVINIATDPSARIIISKKAAATIRENSNYIFPKDPLVKTDFKGIFIKSTDSDSYEQLRSDFTDNVDRIAAINTNKGQKLSIRFDASDPYNTTLLSEADSLVGTSAKRRALKNAKLDLVDSSGRVVGILKGSRKDLSMGNSESLQRARNIAVDQILNRTSDSFDIASVQAKAVKNLNGVPNIKLDSNGNIVMNELSVGTSSSQVPTYGYISEGKLVLKDKSIESKLNSDLNSKGQLRSVVAYNKKPKNNTPVVILNNGGRLYAYPVILKASDPNTNPQISRILNSYPDIKKQAIELNKLAISLGLPKSNLVKLKSDSFDSDFKNLIERISTQSVNISVDSWLQKDRLEAFQDVLINIELSKPFHSPKIAVNFEFKKVPKKPSTKIVESVSTNRVVNKSFKESDTLPTKTPEVRQKIEAKKKSIKKSAVKKPVVKKQESALNLEVGKQYSRTTTSGSVAVYKILDIYSEGGKTFHRVQKEGSRFVESLDEKTRSGNAILSSLVPTVSKTELNQQIQENKDCD